MQFYQKLDFLMNITNTSNSVLGQKLKLDPSYISRLRRGQRNALKDENIIASMAEYFAHYCIADYQLKSISDALNISKAILNSSELQPSIAKWLINEKPNEVKAVGDFMDNFIEINTNLKIPGNLVKTVKPKEDTQKIIPQDDISVFYGVEGKRKAAEFFCWKL